MKYNTLYILLLILFINQQCLANCNPEDIKQQNYYGEPRYAYPVDCHVDYGRLRKIEPLYKEQVKELKKSIEMKDLALKYSDERIETWEKTTYKLEDKLLKLEKNNDRMKWLYFGIGIIVMSGAVYTAKQLK